MPRPCRVSPRWVFAVLAGLLCLASFARAEVLPLPALLEHAVLGASVRAADADLAALEALKQQREAEAGWQWFASASTGRYRELVTEDLIDDYYGRNLALGLRHPLLGSLHRQLALVRNVDSELQQQQARRELYRLEQRLALRSAYTDWWRAQQEQHWCRAFAGTAEQARRHLAERLRDGWLLASEAGLLDARWQALQRSCAGNPQLLDETRESLERLSGQTIGPQQEARAEALVLTVPPVEVWRQALETHPRLAQRREQLQRAEQNGKPPWYAAVESTFSLAQSYEDHSGSSKTGNGLVASISLSAPFDLQAYGRARGDEGLARLQSAQSLLDAERDQLRQGLVQALRAHRQAADELLLARQQLDAVTRAVQEQRLRQEGLVDQDFTAVLGSELEYGQAGLRLIAAWQNLWLREAALRLFTEAGPGNDALLGPATADWPGLGLEETAAPAPLRALATGARLWREGVYVWDSRRLLDPRTRADEWRALEAAGMQRILLGLSAAQLAEPQLQRRLATLLREARARRLEVVLLLGEPQWILPGSRQSLIDLLGRLSALPFDALHLDLEVEQLGWPVPAARLRDWTDTLTQVARSVPWPLEISSHPRWFAPPAAGHDCLPCRLQESGVRQVSLMIYSRNPEQSAGVAEDIARRWPGLAFRLAQSLEPQLSAAESWKGASLLQLKKLAGIWQKRLQAVSVTGIDWQDWSSFPH